MTNLCLHDQSNLSAKYITLHAIRIGQYHIEISLAAAVDSIHLWVILALLFINMNFSTCHIKNQEFHIFTPYGTRILFHVFEVFDLFFEISFTRDFVEFRRLIFYKNVSQIKYTIILKSFLKNWLEWKLLNKIYNSCIDIMYLLKFFAGNC